ncbi:MAG TPA: flagellar filament capping protein FliD [Gammaproteobacteria bacterium]|jgi:flagellar hook-associated protein 2|nr:flagellar filament capping protein FliD [Gammaproteobacteria bacterium]
MPSISVPGVGSGLDVNGIVASLMQVEALPLNQLNDQKKTFTTQLSGFGLLKSSVGLFQTAMKDLGSIDKFQIFTASSSATSVLTASATSAAAAGNYSIVVSQLAQAHKMSSGLTGIADESTSTGLAGTLQIQVGADAFTVDIDGTNDTLAGIRDAINTASDNTGVTATILNVDDGIGGTESHLVLTSTDSGTANSLTVSDVSGNVASGLAMATVIGQGPLDAELTVDGYDVTSSSNSVTGVIQGVTLNLVAAGSSTLTLAYDKTSVKDNIQAFVNSYNALRASISGQKEGALKGDGTVLSMQSLLRDTLNTAPTGLTTSFSTLAEIGIKTERNGNLSLNTTELDAALASDYAGVAALMGNDDQGYAFRMEAVASDMLGIDGLITSRTKGIDARIENMSDRIERMEYRLNLIEERYLAQFSKLDSLLTSLQSTSNYLTQQLANLPGAAS